MRGMNGLGLVVTMGVAICGVGCSNTKYTNQIEQQKLQITELEQKNYQLELEASRQKALADEANRRAAEAATPMDTGGVSLGGETAGVSYGGDAGSSRGSRSGGGETVSERIVLDGEVLFSSGSATLTSKGAEAVRAAATKIKKNYAGASVRVEGHTDNVPIKKSKGKFSSNQDLSKQRADAVAQVLIQQGISEQAVEIVGLGDTKPRSSNGTAAGRAKNRRVEIVVLQ